MAHQIVLPGRAQHLAASPAGPWIACTLSGQKFDAIAIVNFDGSGFRELVPREAMGPIWSPDGKEIAYWKYRGLERGLFVVNVETAMTRRVLNREYPSYFVWSPDGRYIACKAKNPHQSEALVVIDLHDENRIIIEVQKGDFSRLQWLPDNMTLSFENHQVIKFNIKTSQETSISGRTHAVSSQGDMAIEGQERITIITQQRKHFSFDCAEIRDLLWSQDGAFLYLVGQIWERSGLFRVARGSNTPEMLLSNKVMSIWMPVISWNGSQVAFVNSAQSERHILVYPTNPNLT